VTLIAAWRCHPEGIALHADSQEIVPIWNGADWVEYRKTVQKITPQKMGAFQVIVAGSGNASLIESFTIRLRRKLDISPDKNSLTSFEDLLRLDWLGAVVARKP
jgi:hypothetical protein